MFTDAKQHDWLAALRENRTRSGEIFEAQSRRKFTISQMYSGGVAFGLVCFLAPVVSIGVPIVTGLFAAYGLGDWSAGRDLARRGREQTRVALFDDAELLDFVRERNSDSGIQRRAGRQVRWVKRVMTSHALSMILEAAAATALLSVGVGLFAIAAGVGFGVMAGASGIHVGSKREEVTAWKAAMTGSKEELLERVEASEAEAIKDYPLILALNRTLNNLMNDGTCGPAAPAGALKSAEVTNVMVPTTKSGHAVIVVQPVGAADTAVLKAEPTPLAPTPTATRIKM